MEKQNWKNVAILSLSIAVVVCIVAILFLLKRPADNKFTGGYQMKSFTGILKVDKIGPVHEQPTRDNVDSFRQAENGRVASGLGVRYTEDDFRYMREAFLIILAKQKDSIGKKNRQDTVGYDFEIGCYWMLNKDVDDDIKYDFCFAPIMVHRQSGKVIDFFSKQNRFIRNLPVRIPKRRGEKGDTTVFTSAFNTGTMFP
jgi:hypothetical protein